MTHSNAQILSATQALMNPPEVPPNPDDAWVRPRILGWLRDHQVRVPDPDTLSNGQLLRLVRDFLDAP